MNFLNFKKTVIKIKKYPWQETAKSVKFLPHALSLIEKIIVLTLTLVIIFSLGFFWYKSWINSTKLIPDYGGELHEGVVGDTSVLDTNITRLVNAGLTKYDSQKNVVGDLAQSWDIQDGGKTYVFHLRAGFSAADLLNQIKSQNLWTDINITAPDDQTLKFSFKQPFSPFLNVSTEPIFNYGPYQITKESTNEVDLQSRADYYGGKPYIDKIAFIFFGSQDELAQAVKSGNIQSFVLPTDSISMDNSQKFEVSLPQDLDLFFNLNNKDLSDLNIRKDLRDDVSPGRPLKLHLVTSNDPKNLSYAKKLQASWAKIGVTVTLDVQDNVTLQKTTIPKRNYDLLLYGLDYGEDPDPYPFWHSSQIGPNGLNLSNFNDKQADKLLEAARQELDPQKRQDDYTQFQTILDAQVPMFVVEHECFYYHITDDVKGVTQIIGTSESDRFLNVAAWYINTKRVKK